MSWCGSSIVWVLGYLLRWCWWDQNKRWSTQIWSRSTSSSTTIIISANFASLSPTVRPPRIYTQISLHLGFKLSSSPARRSPGRVFNLSLLIECQANTGIERSRITHKLLSGKGFGKATVDIGNTGQRVSSGSTYLFRFTQQLFSQNPCLSPSVKPCRFPCVPRTLHRRNRGSQTI